MPPNDKLAANDAILAGRALAEEVLREFAQEWIERDMLNQLKANWMTMAPEQKEAVKKRDPKMYAKVVAAFDHVNQEV